jgi:hypothetical protein
MHGEYDWVSELHDDRLSVDIVNRTHPGHGTLEIIAGNDHLHTKHSTLAASFQSLGGGTPDDTFFTRCVTWLKGLASR